MKLVAPGSVQRGEEPWWPVLTDLGRVAQEVGTCLSAVRPGHGMGRVLGEQAVVASCSAFCNSTW